MLKSNNALSFQFIQYTQGWIYTPDFLEKRFLLQSLREESLSYYLIFTGIMEHIKKRIFFLQKGEEKELRHHVVYVSYHFRQHGSPHPNH